VVHQTGQKEVKTAAVIVAGERKRKWGAVRLVFTMVLLTALFQGCTAVIHNSEKFYENQPRRPVNWRAVLSD
jgi:hypothetical protein